MAKTVKVINESNQLHRVGMYKKVATKDESGRIKEVREPIFQKDYEFPPMSEDGVPSVTMVPIEDFENMINSDDHTLGRIYTKKQWEARLEAIVKQQALVREFNKTDDPEKQVKLAKKLVPPMDIRYLLENALPHEA